ncbi:hypothetical protein TRICI_002737 [Trichomonascus ciferrii]|uniref:Uncharacterized protein n=1 Tax=Trichomonascus ciferrii TaxID=44093 RepID=A0A642V542_9ASCO|nr:hypothetical protein TRICI_002737 [Trichomonascus ciferrii]
MIFGMSRAGKKATSEQNKPGSKTEDAPQTVDLSSHPIFKRLPKFLHKYAVNFINTPVSHVTSFLVLHELTAIVPLFGLWGVFHYLDYTPVMSDWLMERGIEFIKNMGERNGWDFSKPEAGYKLIVQGAASYAIVKSILPFRAAISLFLTPWFARHFVIPFTRIFRIFKRKKPQKVPDDKIWDKDLKAEIPKKKLPKDPNKPQL